VESKLPKCKDKVGNIGKNVSATTSLRRKKSLAVSEVGSPRIDFRFSSSRDTKEKLVICRECGLFHARISRWKLNPNDFFCFWHDIKCFRFSSRFQLDFYNSSVIVIKIHPLMTVLTRGIYITTENKSHSPLFVIFYFFFRFRAYAIIRNKNFCNC
jgi:hypothetical protein